MVRGDRLPDKRGPHALGTRCEKTIDDMIVQLLKKKMAEIKHKDF